MIAYRKHLRRIARGFFWTSICFGSLMGVFGACAFLAWLKQHNPLLALIVIGIPAFVGVCYMVGTEAEWRGTSERQRREDPRG